MLTRRRKSILKALRRPFRTLQRKKNHNDSKQQQQEQQLSSPINSDLDLCINNGRSIEDIYDKNPIDMGNGCQYESVDVDKEEIVSSEVLDPLIIRNNDLENFTSWSSNSSLGMYNDEEIKNYQIADEEVNEPTGTTNNTHFSSPALSGTRSSAVVYASPSQSPCRESANKTVLTPGTISPLTIQEFDKAGIYAAVNNKNIHFRSIPSQKDASHKNVKFTELYEKIGDYENIEDIAHCDTENISLTNNINEYNEKEADSTNVANFSYFDELFEGEKVSLVGGKYKGNTGIIKKVNPKKVNVYIEGIGLKNNIDKNNVLSLHVPTQTRTEATKKVRQARIEPFCTITPNIHTHDSRKASQHGEITTPIVENDELAHVPTSIVDIHMKSSIRQTIPIETMGATDKNRDVESVNDCVEMKEFITKAALPTNITLLVEGAKVFFVGGTYKGSIGVVEKVNLKTVNVYLDGQGLKKNISKNSIELLPNDTPVPLEMKEKIAPGNSNSILYIEDPKVDTAVSDFAKGAKVLFTGGNYKEHTGVIEKINPKTVNVYIDGIGLKKNISKKSIELLPEGKTNKVIAKKKDHHSTSDTGNQNLTSFELADNLRSTIATSPSARVGSAFNLTVAPISSTMNNEETENNAIDNTVPTKGTKNRKALQERVVEFNNTIPKGRVSKRSKPSDKKRRSRTILSGRSSTKALGQRKFSANKRPRTRSSIQNIFMGDVKSWQLQGSTTGMGRLRFGKRQVAKMRLSTKVETKDQCFLSHYFQNCMQIIEIPLNSTEAENSVDLYVENNGFKYQLVSVKDQDDGDENTIFGPKKQVLQCFYVQVSGPGLPSRSLSNELEKLADFASESSRKAVARIELLQSPVCNFLVKGEKRLGIFPLQASAFTILYENDPSAEGNDGCGYISRDLVRDLFGDNAAANRMLGPQIRAVIPTLGLFKGMLLCKDISSGPPIQLTLSMRKVGPTKQRYHGDDRALLLVTKAGKRPSKNCEMIGRQINPDLKQPPLGWKIEPLNKKSDMIPRLWQSLQVPKQICDDYVKKSTDRNHLAHSYVTGYTDPTDAIPPGYIFVTGTRHLEMDKFFVTRSPCIMPSDGRVLNHLKSKPPEMRDDQWEELNNMPFGAIIFAKAPKGYKPLPTFLANGDLDGDMYFVCWDSDILSCVVTDPVNPRERIEDAISPNDTIRKDASSYEENDNNDWLEKAQMHMVDLAKLVEVGELGGRLWKLSAAAADANKEEFMNDRDAIAYAKAFNGALDYKKHGKPIPLPERLHAELPQKFQKYLI